MFTQLAYASLRDEGFRLRWPLMTRLLQLTSREALEDDHAPWVHEGTSLDVNKANEMLTSHAKRIFCDSVTCFGTNKCCLNGSHLPQCFIKALRFLLAWLLCFYTENPRIFFWKAIFATAPIVPAVTIHTLPWKMRVETCLLSFQYGILLAQQIWLVECMFIPLTQFVYAIGLRKLARRRIWSCILYSNNHTISQTML